AQMGSMVLSYAGYPFTSDGNAPSLPNANPLPFSLCKVGPNVVARPQAYRSQGESMSAYKARLSKTIDCALGQVGLDPSQFQIGVDYTGDSTFANVHGEDMESACKL